MKQLIISVGGGAFITVVLYLLDVEASLLYPPNAIAKVLLWPVTFCLYLVGPGPRIGPPDKNFHEWTPVHSLALVVGIGLSWVFYSGLAFVFLQFRSRHNANVSSSRA
jgi:hypothetical protein